MNQELQITKASGEKARFSMKKLCASLIRAGASEEEADTIAQKIATFLYKDIPTKKIYGMAFRLLKENSRSLAARYHLKQAIMELGPSGYPFEKYFAEILKCQAYTARTGELVQGKCVTHEIDVIAEKDDHVSMIECKYHNQRGIFCDVKVPLYIQARFRDVETQWLQLPGKQGKKYQPWVVTNTRFSTDALQYGTCAGMKLISWDYPAKGSLKDQIDELGLYPITCLTSLTRVEKQRLLDKNIVLCREILNNKPLLENAGIKPSRINSVNEEAEQLCSRLVQKKIIPHG
ncbi:MAG: ATPase [Bacteroidia bacterium]